MNGYDMTKVGATEGMRACIKSLTDKELSLLLYHRRVGTPLLTGEHSNFFTDGKGGG